MNAEMMFVSTLSNKRLILVNFFEVQKKGEKKQRKKKKKSSSFSPFFLPPNLQKTTHPPTNCKYIYLFFLYCSYLPILLLLLPLMSPVIIITAHLCAILVFGRFFLPPFLSRFYSLVNLESEKYQQQQNFSGLFKVDPKIRELFLSCCHGNSSVDLARPRG